ncbi:MAG: hypothetical protein JW822_06960 [Spirochaetales bacterium]|nr:hypothetical protein [Spirochaetales bacterium]
MKKLTPSEITDVVAKIRKKYDEYHYKFFKSLSYKREFEKRYLAALKNNVDISSFLLAEISAIKELIKRAEEKYLNKEIKTNNVKEKSFADKVFEENKRKIMKYNDLNFHKDANEEIRRLFGALNTLEQEYWPNLYPALKSTGYSLNTKTMMNLENQLHELGGSGKEGISPKLERYVTRLNHFPRDYSMVDKEEKNYILETAFLLHDVANVIETVKEKNNVLSEENREKLDFVLDYVANVINDFRLKEFKKKY